VLELPSCCRICISLKPKRFNFPDWTAQEIYNGFGKIRVADEHHFEPLWRMHQLLRDMRLARTYLGHLRMTRAGKELFSRRFRAFDAVTQAVLFEALEFRSERQYHRLMGGWDIWLNVIDIEAQGEVTGRALTEAFYGPVDPTHPYDPKVGAVYSGVLKPLVWSGLLREDMPDGRKVGDRVYTLTPLWKRYLELDQKPPRLRIMK
jgi:hypothetical protein